MKDAEAYRENVMLLGGIFYYWYAWNEYTFQDCGFAQTIPFDIFDSCQNHSPQYSSLCQDQPTRYFQPLSGMSYSIYSTVASNTLFDIFDLSDRCYLLNIFASFIMLYNNAFIIRH
ncbi:hypothetical protein Tcan_00712, partial [Toxocara canis]